MLDISFDANFSCTSLSPEDQVDDLSGALHTDSVLSGRYLEQRRSVKEDVGNEDFSSFSSFCRESLALKSCFLY